MGQRRIEILILLFTFLLILSVGIMGSLTFQNLTIIEKQSRKIYEPNHTVIHLKNLMAGLRDAESSIQAYTLYNNAEYLASYDRALSRIDSSFDRLYNNQAGNSEMTALLDSTEQLVEQKIMLLNRLLTLRNEAQVVDEVNRIITRLNKVSKAQPHLKRVHTERSHDWDENPDEFRTTTTQERKKGFFSRLFRKDYRKDPIGYAQFESATDKNGMLKKIPALDSATMLWNKGLEEVKSEVTRVKQNQESMMNKMRESELQLLEEDKVIWSRLVSILSLLETKQNDMLKEIALSNIQQSNKTHRLTRISGVMIIFMLTFIVFLSVYYFYTGDRRRKALDQAVAESKTLARARETFLANMSHEMRTPLNAITGFTEQLITSPLNEEQKKQLNIINSASRHLLNLINDVLDISKIEADKVRLEKISFNPLEQIREVVELLKPKATYKNLDLTLQAATEMPPGLIGDPHRLKQILLNLLGNSIKFTHEGSIRVEMECRTDAGGTDMARLNVTVADTGIGISEDMKEKIFENFTQADTSITRKYGGTGLGLSITKKIIELQSGEIHIDSEPGKGTSVRFSIPYTVDPEMQAGEPEVPDNYIPLNAKGRKVLIADDELFNRILLITILKRWEISYDEAVNGQEVIDLVEQHQYDMILMDVRMPEVSGIDASQRIRRMSDPRKSQIPIIALTAAASIEKREKCLAAGMNEVITKPYNEKELIRVMETVLSAAASSSPDLVSG